ncbi:MAG: hypothetical protein P8Y18_10360 [Candidatus Bathyarchaeota archaeon]
MPNTYRIKNWEDFKKIAYSKKPKSIVYVIAQSLPSKDYTGLKLILPVENAQYIFTDTAKDDKMRRTKIPIKKGSKGNRFLTDDDIKRFLRTELDIKDLKIFSYWTA